MRALTSIWRKAKRSRDFFWSFVNGEAIQNRFASMADVPPQTPLSRTIAKELKARGFRFCGPTTTYSLMQACGLVNDHLTSCHRHDACAALASGPVPTFACVCSPPRANVGIIRPLLTF